jgi:hypothetical protein
MKTAASQQSLEPSTVGFTHVILATQEDHCSQVQPGKTVSNPPISTNKKLDTVACAYQLSYIGSKQEDCSPVWPRHKSEILLEK